MWLTLLATAWALPVSFERVDLVAEAPGTWLADEVGMIGVYPTGPALRFVSQISAVWSLPVEGLTVQTSLTSQNLDYEGRLFDCGDFRFAWHWGLQTRLLLPTGWMFGLAAQWKVVRFGLGLSVISGASWDHPSWNHWRVLPTLGLGVGRSIAAD